MSRDETSPMEELPNGVRILRCDNCDDLLREHGLDVVLKPWNEISTAEQQTLVPKLDTFATSIALAFLDNQITYWHADAAINSVVSTLGHESCPKYLFEIFLAFEDAECERDPVPKAKQLLKTRMVQGDT